MKGFLVASLLRKTRHHVSFNATGFGLGVWKNDIHGLPKWTVAVGPFTIHWPLWFLISKKDNTGGSGPITYWALYDEAEVDECD